MTHIDERTYYKCEACGDDYLEYDWQGLDYHCPACNSDEYEKGYECEDCGRFITDEDICDGWHIECAEKEATLHTAMKFTAWENEQIAIDTYGKDYTWEQLSRVMTETLENMNIGKRGFDYIGYALSDIEIFIDYLNVREKDPQSAVLPYSRKVLDEMAEEVARNIAAVGA